MAIFVNESRELDHACVPHVENLDATVKKNILIKSNININSLIHVKPVLIDEGGLFAGHTGWLDCLMKYESSARVIVLWQGRDSILHCGGSASDLLAHNIWYKEYVISQEVLIDGLVMDGLKHEFIFMPLAFIMQSEKTSQLEINKTKAYDMVQGQVFAKYKV